MGSRTRSDVVVVPGNRLSHSLRSKSIVIGGAETVDEWHAFHDAVVESIAPDGDLESSIAARIAEVLWRLRRVPRAETMFIADAQTRDDHKAHGQQRRAAAKLAGVEPASFYDMPEVDVAFVEPPRRVIPDDDALDSVIRYEAHLNRQLATMLHEIEALQRRRQGDSAPLLRVDVQNEAGS